MLLSARKPGPPLRWEQQTSSGKPDGILKSPQVSCFSCKSHFHIARLQELCAEIDTLLGKENICFGASTKDTNIGRQTDVSITSGEISTGNWLQQPEQVTQVQYSTPRDPTPSTQGTSPVDQQAMQSTGLVGDVIEQVPPETETMPANVEERDKPAVEVEKTPSTGNPVTEMQNGAKESSFKGKLKKWREKAKRAKDRFLDGLPH